MSDFSAYGIPSAEWKPIALTLPSPSGSEPSIIDLKRTTNLGREQVSQSDMVDLQPLISVADFSIPSRDGQKLEARTYRSRACDPELALPIYMHFHGGGFLFGTLQSEDAICARIALATGAIVLNVNYRHTPEHTYPTAWNDAEDALCWVCKDPGRFKGDPAQLVVGGVSAGAYIAAALTQTVLGGELPVAIQPQPQIRGQVLMIPCLVFSACYASQLAQLKNPSVSSYRQAANAPILNMARKNLFNSLLKVEQPDPHDLRLNPAHISADQARHLPPTTLGIAGNDPLRDEGLLYGKLLAESG